MRRDKRGCIYFITDGTGCVKIGKTERQIAERLADLQVGNPRKLEVKKRIMTSYRTDLDVFENDLHKVFKEKRITTNAVSEWFKDANEILYLTKNLTCTKMRVLRNRYGDPVYPEAREKWIRFMKEINEGKEGGSG